MSDPVIISLELPLPPEVLHPNGRTKNLKYRAAMVKKARGEACLVARCQRPARPWVKATIQATFYMARQRDQDGLISWCKAYCDGIQDSQVILNDSGLQWLPPVQMTGKDSRGERKLILEIREAT